LIINEFTIHLVFLEVISKKLNDEATSAKKIQSKRGVNHKFSKLSIYFWPIKNAGEKLKHIEPFG